MASLTPQETMKSWFEIPDWSDLTIELSGGRKIPVHRTVLCTRNAYFNAMCGLKSRFAESGQKEIKMEDEDADVLWALLRHIYGLRPEWHNKRPWQYWLDLAKAADKYLAPELVSEAADAMMMRGLYLTVRVDSCGKDGGPSCNVESICDILDAFQEIDSIPKGFDCAERLATRIQEHVHDSDRFRAHLSNNPKLMLKMIENETRQPDACITGIDACEYHMQTHLARTEPLENGPCVWCEDDERPVERYNIWYVKCGSS